ncbi:alpha/beta fold hydrolase [Amycolatopsis carbonis]|uniref:Alpha/beta fold hydrolase n=1 Tax=Amycolatopsis carbonis TaxID=715471 RepID=A0A9Y2IK55_9PSEU|nr:alpha/beta fold hydrolase [Amycolatopsis sp. 2-15]WIX79813.1 alpha/beta fold hydrolase [Amycolatopsis sp. 2-15]
MQQSRRMGRAGIPLLATILATSVFVAPAGATPGITECRNVVVPVTVGGATGPIAGTLCTPPGAKAVQLLVSGWTYNRGYFDFGYQPETYSYAQAANRDGYATLAIDRLGSGASLHPLSLFDTFEADVRTVHEVVSALRGGSLGTAFSSVATVGHSVGAAVVATEAGKYHDVGALVTTGFSHAYNYANGYVSAVGRDEPAVGDPRFAGLALDPLYVTSDPGTAGRSGSLYYAPNADPAVVAYDDEHLRDTDNLVEGATFSTYPVNDSTRTLDVPVLDVAGDHDPLFCGLTGGPCSSSATLAEFEKRFYAPGAPVEAYVVLHTGHDLTLEKTSPESTARILEFVDAHLGQGRGATETTRGPRPPLPRPEPAQPSAPATLLSTAFVTAVQPLAEAYDKAVPSVPGLGDQTSVYSNPAAAAMLAEVSGLVDQFAGDAVQSSLGG